MLYRLLPNLTDWTTIQQLSNAAFAAYMKLYCLGYHHNANIPSNIKQGQISKTKCELQKLCNISCRKYFEQLMAEFETANLITIAKNGRNNVYILNYTEYLYNGKLPPQEEIKTMNLDYLTKSQRAKMKKTFNDDTFNVCAETEFTLGKQTFDIEINMAIRIANLMGPEECKNLLNYVQYHTDSNPPAFLAYLLKTGDWQKHAKSATVGHNSVDYVADGNTQKISKIVDELTS